MITLTASADFKENNNFHANRSQVSYSFVRRLKTMPSKLLWLTGKTIHDKLRKLICLFPAQKANVSIFSRFFWVNLTTVNKRMCPRLRRLITSTLSADRRLANSLHSESFGFSQKTNFKSHRYFCMLLKTFYPQVQHQLSHDHFPYIFYTVFERNFFTYVLKIVAITSVYSMPSHSKTK